MVDKWKIYGLMSSWGSYGWYGWYMVKSYQLNLICLVVWNTTVIFPYTGNVIIPIDELRFFRGFETTNQWLVGDYLITQEPNGGIWNIIGWLAILYMILAMFKTLLGWLNWLYEYMDYEIYGFWIYFHHPSYISGW